MNIFVLDRDIKKAAEYHCDKHVVKMILETAQLLCSVHWATKGEDAEDIPYKLSHINHPCSIWARECLENYNWLCMFGIALAQEYSYRYKKNHKSELVIQWAFVTKPDLPLKGNTTEFAMAMPDDCKVGDVVESYREYYRRHKQTWERKNKKTGEVIIHEHTWTGREKPHFMLG